MATVYLGLAARVHAADQASTTSAYVLCLYRPLKSILTMCTGCLLIIDSLNPLAASTASQLPALLSSFINPSTSLLALYHTDVPLSGTASGPYSPAPLTLLRYLATTLISTHSLSHMLARKAARERSVVEPSFGLEEGVEGILQGLGANSKEGFVLEMEHRRKSGRGVREWFFLPQPAKEATATGPASKMRETVILLEDHPSYRTVSEEAVGGSEEPENATFELGLTEKQRQARKGVVLPYFDAQQGGGEGGRILYDIGAEDDFDEDEDEI